MEEKKLYTIIKDKKLNIENIDFQVWSYGIEVFISFLEEVVKKNNKKINKKIKSVSLWGSPVTE